MPVKETIGTTAISRLIFIFMVGNKHECSPFQSHKLREKSVNSRKNLHWDGLDSHHVLIE